MLKGNTCEHSALAPCEQHVRALPEKTCLTCSWLHLLKGCSLLNSLGDSVSVLPARLADLHAKLEFFADADDLAVSEFGLIHAETPWHACLYSVGFAILIFSSQ